MSFLDSVRATTPRRQILVVALAAVAIAAALFAVYFFVLRKPYEVLFSQLRPMDAATIVADLDKKKIPYRLKDGGATILVPKEKVDATRLNVMSEDLPLKGMVGFELFNKSDMGLTEFAQRINYQRALQGELARTIMTMDEIDTARIHLSIAEPTIFRDDRRPSKASVSLRLRPGKELAEGAVKGIQRLVAAAVPDLDTANVVVLDDLGRVVSNDSLPDAAESSTVRAVEQLYAERIRRALEKDYPSGSFQVDVRAGPEAVRQTPPAASGEVAATDASPAPADAVPAARTFPLRVNISVSAPLTSQGEATIRTLALEALGADAGLGDSVNVTTPAPSAIGESALSAATSTPDPASSFGARQTSPQGFWYALLVPAGLLLAVAAVFLHRSQNGPRRLTERQRQDYARRLRAVLDRGEANAFPPI